MDAKGRVYVFGGNVYLDGQRTGGGRFGLVYFDPERSDWIRAPEPRPMRISTRRPIFSNAGTRFVIDEMSASPRFELPSGASDGRRAYWFTDFLGPIYFDADQGGWGQPPAPLYDQQNHRYEGPVPFYRRMAAATAVGPDGRIWLLGGWGRKWGPEPPGMRRKRELDHFGVLASLEVYDPVANSYMERAAMAQPRWLFAACFGADGKLYAFGGFGAASGMRIDEGDPQNERKRAERSRMAREALRSVESYDSEANTWTPRAPLPEPRQNMACALGADRRIYVIGGVPSYVEADDAQRSVFVYDPAKDSWSRGPSLITERQGHTAVSTKEGLIYAIGGRNSRSSLDPAVWFGGESGPLASVEVLDTAPQGAR